MSWWEALILGIVQGATEFLPVSSSGHLVLTQELMGLTLPGVVFEVTVHVATLVSILLVYRDRVTWLLTGTLRGDREAIRYAGWIVLATLPAAAVGLSFKDQIEAGFDNPLVVAGAFLATGALLWSTRSALKRNPEGRPNARIALLMGIAQAFALIPGISRSGSTVVAALWLGVAGREAAAFSFLMAVPAIAGAAVLQLPDVQGTALSGTVLGLGFLSAAVTGVLAIRGFVVLLRRQEFHWFSYYLWPLGLAFGAFLLLR